jgi:hypothetical protein
MRYVKTPEAINLTRFDGSPFYKEGTKEQATLEFEAFIHGRLRDPKFGNTMDGVNAAANIAQALREAKGDGTDYIVIDEADWNLLVEVTKNPSQGLSYSPEVAACAIPFFDAITQATKDRPKKRPDDEPEAG